MPHNRHRMRMPQCILVFFALLTSMGCEKQPSAQPIAEAHPTKVSIASPTMRRPIETRRYSGRLQADQRVEVRARVKGYLDQVLFQEGTEVTKGAELYVNRRFRQFDMLDRFELSVSSKSQTLNFVVVDFVIERLIDAIVG